MPATDRYDVVLDNQGFLIDPETYRGRLKAQLAPKTRTGDAGFGDLSGSSAWAQRDFTGGFGYLEWDPAHPDRFADGTAIDISYGDLRPGRSLGAAVAGISLIAPLVIHKGVLYGIQTGGQVNRSADGVTWVATSPLSFAPPASLWVHGGLLTAGSATTGEVATYDGAIWTATTALPGATGIPVGFQQTYQYPGIASVVAVKGVWGAVTGPPTATPGETSFYQWLGAFTTYANSTPYDQVDVIATDGTQMFAGVRQTGATGVVTGALYHVPVVGSAPFELVQRIHDNAITSFQVYRGQLLAGSYTKGIIWKVTDTGLEPFFQVPELAMSGTPPAYSNPIRQMTTDNDRLYVPITDREGACIYQFDGTGWCRFTNAVATTAQALIAFGGAIILATAAGVYRAVPGYASPATYITSWFDAALGGVDKLPLSCTLTHAPLAAGQSITVEYAVNDAAAWTTLGVSNTVGATEMALTFPGTIDADRIRFRYTFTGSTSANPIKLRTVVFQYQLVPDVKREWLFTALCAGVPGKELVRIDETAEPLTGAQISDMLWTSRAKKQVLDYTDIDQAAYRVTFESLEEEIDRGRPRAELATRAAVRLAEV